MTKFSIIDYRQRLVANNAEGVNEGWVNLNDRLYINYDTDMVLERRCRNWTFLWYGEHNTLPNLEATADFLDAESFDALWGVRGVLIAINLDKKRVYIFNDCYGSFPVFFSEPKDNCETIVSNSIFEFSDKCIDWTSFYQFLCFGYIIGEHSIFDGAFRLMANSCLEVNFSGPTVGFFRHRLKNFWQSHQHAHDRKIDDLIDILASEADEFEGTQLMMSGGWDSRLVLSVLSNNNPTLFTHGNLQSRENEIVRQIARLGGLDLKEQAIADISFDADLFSYYLRTNESAMFSHWSAAGKFADRKNLVMTAGTFGEVLGGHYGTLNSLPGKTKHASLLMHMLGMGMWFDARMGLRDVSTIADYLKVANYNVFWLLNDNISENLKSQNLLEISNHRLKSVLQFYADQGMADGESVYERFYTEHRGGQYINLQLSNSARSRGYRNIFTNKDLVEVVSSISFGCRAHNKLNKRIIKKLNPRLLRFPLAATLADARRPMVIQEASRAYRKLIEKSSYVHALYDLTSKYGGRSFGWNDFHKVVDREFANVAHPFLDDSLWDHRAIIRVIETQDKFNMYPLFDMLSKAMTLNYWIRGQ